MLRRTEPSGEVCVSAAPVSQRPPSCFVTDPRPVNQARLQALAETGREPGCGSGHFACWLDGIRGYKLDRHPDPALPDA